MLSTFVIMNALHTAIKVGRSKICPAEISAKHDA
jgi:hypothetical protein